ncbi:MAG: LON peptidase substrate-binding domain-containing protein [Alphaproteobacteria bacterium]|nr:LON peptidase substrate-binding domain-containing protein [Alphaproteobacteria bacterium]
MIETAPNDIRQLPREVPIFPLSGAVLLPRAHLPLHIFEPRYLAMIEDASAGDGVIGMIQPRQTERQEPDDTPEIYGAGCLGRIVETQRNEDGRKLITLLGLCRFDVVGELPPARGYRRVTADYARFAGDLDEPGEGAFDRERLLSGLNAYFAARGVGGDWDRSEEAADELLIAAMTMICPFAPSEKQALLECPNLNDRAQMLTTLVEMSVAGTFGTSAEHH